MGHFAVNMEGVAAAGGATPAPTAAAVFVASPPPAPGFGVAAAAVAITMPLLGPAVSAAAVGAAAAAGDAAAMALLGPAESATAVGAAAAAGDAAVIMTLLRPAVSAAAVGAGDPVPVTAAAAAGVRCSCMGLALLQSLRASGELHNCKVGSSAASDDNPAAADDAAVHGAVLATTPSSATHAADKGLPLSTCISSMPNPPSPGDASQLLPAAAGLLNAEVASPSSCSASLSAAPFKCAAVGMLGLSCCC